MLQNVPLPSFPRQKKSLSAPIVEPASGKGGVRDLFPLFIIILSSYCVDGCHGHGAVVGGLWLMFFFLCQ